MIKNKLEINTKYKVLILSDRMSISWKYFGNFIVQYNICAVGKTKLKKNNKAKNIVTIMLEYLLSWIFGIPLNPWDERWYFAPPLE